MAPRTTMADRAPPPPPPSSPPADPEGAADDALVESILDEALAGYEHLPADVLAEIRASLGDVLAAHPAGQRILRQLKDDPIVAKSSDQAIDGSVEHESDAKKASG